MFKPKFCVGCNFHPYFLINDKIVYSNYTLEEIADMVYKCSECDITFKWENEFKWEILEKRND